MSGTGKYRQIVDENDNLVGHTWKEEFDPVCDIYRVAALWLRNANGEVLLAQRAFKKKNGGGKWGPATAGTLEYDETYDDNIRKEIAEEIGLSDVVLMRGAKRYVEADGRKYFCTYFYANSELPAESFVLEDEVEAVKWVSEAWLKEDVKLHPDLYVQGLINNLDGIMNDCRSEVDDGNNAKTVASYQANSTDYIASRSPEQSAEYCQWIVDGLKDVPKSASIFEIGTGTGYDADYLESVGYHVTRSDIADGFIDFNRKRGMEIIKFDIVKDDFTSTYDVVLAVNVMQHLDADEFRLAIRKIAGVLPIGGRFLFSITVGDGGEEWHDDERGARYFLNWHHDELIKAIESVGFTVIYEKEIGYRNWVDIIVEKI